MGNYREENMKRFYVYIHIKTNGEIFYVGKGSGKRAFVKSGRNDFWNSIVDKHGYDVFILENNLYESEAFELESKYIERIGRRDLGKGTLVNMSDGGESGRCSKLTDSHKLNISKSLIGKRYDTYKGMTGLTHSVETKRKMSVNQMGKVPCDETRRKMSVAQKERFLSNPQKGRLILDLQTGIYYESKVEASQSLDIPYYTLKNWLSINIKSKNKSSLIYV